MKKFFVIVLSLCMLLSLAACGGGKDGSPSVDAEAQGQLGDDSSLVGEVVPLSDTYRVPFNEIRIDGPSYEISDKEYSRVYFDGDFKCLLTTCLYMDTSDTLDDAYSQVCEQLIVDLSDVCPIKNIECSDKNILTIDNLHPSIEKVETMRFRGYAEHVEENENNVFLYGYSFIIGQHPCSVIGVVTDPSQSQEAIDEIVSVIDAMMNSVRLVP